MLERNQRYASILHGRGMDPGLRRDDGGGRGDCGSPRPPDVDHRRV